MDENRNEMEKMENTNHASNSSNASNTSNAGNTSNSNNDTPQDYCPCCPNHCQADALECGKGTRYFQENRSEGEHFREHHHGQGHGFHGRCPGHLNREDMSLEDILLYQFRSCTHFFRYGMGGKTGQQRILAMLAERGIITQRELQDMLGVQSGSLSEILNKVETCGYIMRRQNERDRRQMNLELTDSGMEAARNFREEHMKKARAMFDGLKKSSGPPCWRRGWSTGPVWRKEEPADRGLAAGSAGEVFREQTENTGQRTGAAEEGWEADIPYKKQTSETRAGRIFLVLPLFCPVCILPYLF